MNKNVAIILSLSLFCFNAFGANTKTTVKKSHPKTQSTAVESSAPKAATVIEPTPLATTPTPPIATEERNKNESWYFQFNLGGATQRYGSGIEPNAKIIRDSSLTSHSTVFLDLNFLWPLGLEHNSALGVTLGGIVDLFKLDAIATELTLNYSILGATYQHYLTSNFGDGFFLRGDAGFCKPSSESKVSGVTTKGDAKTGVGLRAGVGYSFLLSNETRLPLSIMYQRVFSKDTDGTDAGAKAVIFAAGLTF